tara:strand:+ start:23 stop:280 length:258 start_codon:yes stop_codon:yes gene_type:complete
MSTSTTIAFLAIFGFLIIKKKYKEILGLLYLLICIILSGYIFIGFKIQGFSIIENEIKNTSQFFKFLFGWILLYCPYLLYYYKNK